MELHNDYLATDELQFGFKKDKSCNDSSVAVKNQLLIILPTEMVMSRHRVGFVQCL